MQEQDVAIAAVREAMRLCQAVQRELSANTLQKTDQSPVTVADFGSQALICRAIRKAFPEDPIVAEETSGMLREEMHQTSLDAVLHYIRCTYPHALKEEALAWIDFGDALGSGPRFWTLDPIDGTKGFLRGDQYAIALALIIDGEVEVGVLGCPNLPDGEHHGVIYSAVQGRGAYRHTFNGDRGSYPIHVSTLRDPRQARFCESFVAQHSAHGESAAAMAQLGSTTAPVRMDSQAKYAVVARGDSEVYLRLPHKTSRYVENIWDHAAGMLVVTEAGGCVTDMHGAPLDFRHGKHLEANQGIVATNGFLHEAVLNTLRTIEAA